MLGGNGYVEECVLPRIYREMPVNSIWEGSGNVMCLDVLRALERTPNAADVLAAARSTTPRRPTGATPPSSAAWWISSRALPHAGESQARALARDLVLALQAALLIRHAPPFVADAFCASRLDGDGGPPSASCRPGSITAPSSSARHRVRTECLMAGTLQSPSSPLPSCPTLRAPPRSLPSRASP